MIVQVISMPYNLPMSHKVKLIVIKHFIILLIAANMFTQQVVQQAKVTHFQLP